jgi:regulator of ribonuclease activity A
MHMNRHTTMTESPSTADLCDRHGEAAAVCHPVFQGLGGRRAFAGPCATVKCHEDNSRVAEALAEPGQGRVLVVDGGGSLRCALLGDRLARVAVDNGWAGVVVNGCVRDSAVLAGLDLGVRALAAHPRRSEKRGEGAREVTVRFAGVTFRPGALMACDADGVVVIEGSEEV